ARVRGARRRGTPSAGGRRRTRTATACSTHATTSTHGEGTKPMGRREILLERFYEERKSRARRRSSSPAPERGRERRSADASASPSGGSVTARRARRASMHKNRRS